MKLTTIGPITSVLFLCALTGLRAQAPQSNSFIGTPLRDGAAQLASGQAAQIQEALNDRLRALANVICKEEISRYARRGRETNQVDTLHLSVEVLDGIEKYSEIRRKEKSYSNMQKVPGTWSVGEMATLLSATRDAIEIGQIRISREDVPDLGPSSVITFSYTAESHRWYLLTHSRVHWLPFEGRMWISPETGEIRRITWYAKAPPTDTGVSQVLWTVDFSPVDLSPVIVTLPEKATLQVTYNNGGDRSDWNVTRFSQYKRYGSEIAIHFDD